MSKRDVELIIKAKNEASSAVDGVSKSLAELKERQEVLGASAKKTDGILGELAGELDRLKAVAGTLGALDKLKATVDQAGGAFSRQADELARSRNSYRELVKDQQAAQQAAEPLRAQVEKQSKALAEERKQVEKTSRARAQAAQQAIRDAKAVESAEKALEKARVLLNEKPTKTRTAKVQSGEAELEKRRQAAALSAAAEAALTAALSAQSESLKKNQAAQTEAAKQLKQLDQTLSTLETRITSTGAAVARNTSLLSSAGAEYLQLVSVVQRAESEFSRAAVAQGVQSRSAAEAAVQVAVLKARMQELAAAQRGTGRKVPLIDSDSIRDATYALTEGRRVIALAGDSATKSAVSMRQLGQAVDAVSRSSSELNKLGKTLKEQEARVESARASWAAAQAEVKRLAAAMNASAQPGEQLAAAFGRAQGQARAAKTAFLEERAAADAMAAGLHNAGLGSGSLASAQEALAAHSARAGAALGAGRSAILSYQGAASGASEASGRAAAGARRIGQAGQEAATGIRALARELLGLNNETRTSLSFGQRIRGQVLGLAAAAGGVYAAQAAISGVVKASMDMESVQSRLSVAFQGDQARVAHALKFTRQTADELGLSYRTLALQYSRLAAASLGSSLEGSKTERIFYALSEASRVLRLSDEELAGSFKAITDIMSKGTIQAEELKGQLGDRFPGAILIMARAAGVGTDELMKMMAAGKLTSEYLVGFAEEISKRVGPAKAEAVKSTAAQFDRLKNSILDIQLTVADSGFLKELSDGAADLSEALKDPAVIEGFRKLGEALGGVVESAADFLPYTEKIILFLKTLAVFVATKVGVGMLGDTVKGLMGLKKGYDYLAGSMKTLGTAAAAAGGGVKGLALALRGVALASGGIAAVGVALAVIGSAAYDAYQEWAKLDKMREETADREKKANRELLEAQKALEAMLEKNHEGYKAGARAKDEYIRSTDELAKMSKEEIDAYQEVLLARMKIVGALRTQEVMKPVDEQSVELIASLNAEERALTAAVEESARWEAARTAALENTAAAAKDVGESLDEAFARADSLRTRMDAVAKANFDNTVLALERVRDARVAALTLSGADESQILQANAQFEERKLQVIRQYSDRQYEIIRQDEERRKQILAGQSLDATKRAEELTKIEQQASQARVQVAQQEVQAVSAAREQALSRYLSALQKVADMDRRIADIRLNGEFQVADIRRSAMTDIEAYRSREIELAQLNGRIQQEIAKGNLDVAEALAQRQLSLAQALNTEVKNGEDVVLSKEAAAAKAVAGTQKANENLIAVLEKRKAIAQQEADEQKKLYENLTATLEKLNTTLARMAGATPIDIPLTLEEKKVQDDIERVKSQIRGQFMADKIGVPVTADTREYVQKFDSDVLSKDGHIIRVGVFLEDGAYKIKVNEIKGEKITATAAVEFSDYDLEKAIARAKEIVAGDFPRMQIALDSAKTYSDFQALSDEVRRRLSTESFVVTSQFDADTTKVDTLIQKYSTERTPAPVEFQPDTTAAERARAVISQPIVVPITYQPTGDVPARAKGGVIQVPGFATGGSPGGYIRGPGSTTSDSILAAVSNKEYVVRALAVRKYGMGFMNALNAGTLDMNRVKDAMGESTRATVGGNGDSMTVNLTINGRQIGGLSGSRSSVMGLVDALHEVARQTGG